MKKWQLILFISLFFVSVVIAPFIINELYKTNNGYITLWEARDVLAYFGAIISAIGTIFIGIVAIQQNNRANKINEDLTKLTNSANVISEKMLRIENEKQIPAIDFMGYNLGTRHDIGKIMVSVSNEPPQSKLDERWFIVKNISNIYINEIKINYLQVDNIFEAKSFVFKDTDLQSTSYVSNYLGGFEEKRLVLSLPLALKNTSHQEGVEHSSITIKMDLKLKTITNRVFIEHLEFQNDLLFETDKTNNSLLFMHNISLQEDK